MVQIWLPNEDVRKVESWGPGIIPDKGGDVDPDGESSDSQRFQGGQRRSGPWVLVLHQEEWAAEFQADSGPIPGNSQRCSARYKFPRGQQR